MMSARLTLAIVILACTLSSVDAGETRTLLYDVSFGTPPHTVGDLPVTGAGDAPRDRPTEINFGDPTVVEALGALADQPCAFGNGTTGYDQLQFEMSAQAPWGFPEVYEVYHLSMNVLIEELHESYFVLLLDLPQVHNVYFNADGTMSSFPSGLNSTFTFGVPLLLEVTCDIPARRWTVRVDGEVIHVDQIAGSSFEHFRLSLTGEHVDDAVAVDNIVAYGENRPVLHVCCVGEQCSLTDQDRCDELGGDYFIDQDECEPENPCAPTPVRVLTWGGLKMVYR